MVISVAMDSREGDPREWIEKANPGYVTLIDRYHRVAGLYHMVNVPQAVWIDERGRIVRPVESAGAYEGFRSLDLATGKLPDDVAAKTANAKQTYVDAIRDWVTKGESSAFVFDAAQARARLERPSADIAEAHANFRLGQYLARKGRETDAEPLFRRAVELHPDSWNMWRQSAEINDQGLAAGPEFWARVEALGEKRYYAPVDMAGMPE